MSKAITAVPNPHQQRQQAEADRDEARQQLLDAEAQLAQEQAAVNAFRMQCRLKLGDLIEETLSLRAERESCLTQLKLHQQEAKADLPPETADPFGTEDGFATETGHFDEIVLPELATPKQEKEAAKRLYRALRQDNVAKLWGAKPSGWRPKVGAGGKRSNKIYSTLLNTHALN